MKAESNCFCCGGDEQTLIHHFKEPPKGELSFCLKDYSRKLLRCDTCGLYFNRYAHDISAVYSGTYRELAYDGDAMHNKFLKIINLPNMESDNYGRIKRLESYRKENGVTKNILDIGSGLGTFPFMMCKKGWDVACIDPDIRNIEHIKSLGNIRAFCDTAENFHIDETFSIVSYNKVLEHLTDPVKALQNTKRALDPLGFVYVEVPDGDSAIKIGPQRQEFFIEHIYCFNFASIDLMARKSGFQVAEMHRLKEPSGKFTIFAFLKPC